MPEQESDAPASGSVQHDAGAQHDSAAQPTHPAVTRAAELLAGTPDLDVDDHAVRLEQVHAELQAALADAERPAGVHGL